MWFIFKKNWVVTGIICVWTKLLKVKAINYYIRRKTDWMFLNNQIKKINHTPKTPVHRPVCISMSQVSMQNGIDHIVKDLCHGKTEQQSETLILIWIKNSSCNIWVFLSKNKSLFISSMNGNASATRYLSQSFLTHWAVQCAENIWHSHHILIATKMTKDCTKIQTHTLVATSSSIQSLNWYINFSHVPCFKSDKETNCIGILDQCRFAKSVIANKISIDTIM